MNIWQKLIKYFALALAFSIIVSIVSLLVGTITFFSSVLGLQKNDEIVYLEPMDLNQEILKAEINKIDIELLATSLKINRASSFNIESNNDKIEVRVKNNTLYIKEKESFLFNKSNKKIVLSLPEKIYDVVEIEGGAGTIEIFTLESKNMELDLGAGKTVLTSLNIYDKMQIDAGVGSLEFMESNVNNLDLDLGVGKTVVSAILTGNSEIDMGIGAVELNLLDSLQNYTFNLEKGIGSITLNSEKIDSDKIYGNGINKILVSGGIGAIKITTQN